MTDGPTEQDPRGIANGQQETSEAAAKLGAAALDLGEAGSEDMNAGADDIAYAQGLADRATGEAMLAASDLTRAVDANIVADRLSKLSEVVATAGINDIGQGAELIAAADDVDAVSAAVGLMSVDDLDKGLELGRISGELRVLGRIVDQVEMPVLSAVLSDRSERLTEIATDTILRAAATRSLTDLIEATGRRIGEMGEEEVDEGVLRLAASDIASERSAELAAAGLILAESGAAELDMAAEDADLAEEFQAYGSEEVAAGAASLGAAAVLADEADTIGIGADSPDQEAPDPGTSLSA